MAEVQQDCRAADDECAGITVQSSEKDCSSIKGIMMGTYACISCRDKLCEYLSCNEVDIDALKTKVRDVRKKCNAAVKKSSEKKREADKDYQIYAYPYGSEYPSDSANDVKMTDGSQTDCDSKIKTNTENLYRIIEPFVDFTFIGGTSSNGIYKECFKRSATKETRENNSQYKVKAFIIKSIDYSLKYLVKNPCPAKDGKKFTDEVKANVKAVLEQLSESTSFNHTVQHLNKEFEKEDLKIKEYTGLLQFQKEFIDGVFELRLASGGDIILTPLSSLLDEIQLDDQGANRDQDSIRLGLDKLNSVIEHLYFNGMQMCANISKNENVLRISRRLHTYKAIDFSTVDRDEYSKLLGIPDSQFQYIKNKNYVGNLNLTSLEKSLCERENLEKLLLNIRNNRDTIVCGKAGSGKSMLAILAFVEQYRRFVTPGQTDARVPINLYPERLYNQCRDNEFKERLIINECERSEEVSHEILSKTSVLFIDNIDEFLSDNTTLTFSIVNCLVDIPMVIFCRSKIRDTIVRQFDYFDVIDLDAPDGSEDGRIVDFLKHNDRVVNAQPRCPEDPVSEQYADAFHSFFSRNGIDNRMLMTLMIKSVSQPVCRDAGQNGEEKQFFTFDVLPTALSDRCYRMPSSAYHQVVHDMIEEKDRHINNHLCALGYRGVSTYDIFSIFREYAWVRFHTSRGIDTSISQVAEKLEMDKFVVRVVVYSLSDGTSTHGFIHRSIMDYLIAQAIISRTEPRDLKDAFFTVINSRISEHIANSLVSKIAADREGHDPIEYSIGPFLDCMKCCDGMDDTFRRMNILYIIGKFMMAATESNSVSAKRAGLWVKDHLQRLYSEYSNDGEKEKRGECFVILYVLVESGVGDYEQDLLGMFDEDPDIVRISYGAFKGDIPFRAALEQREIEGMRLDNVIPEILNASNSSNPRHLNMKGFLTRLLKSYQDNGYQIPEEFENDVSDLIGNNNNMNETIRNQSVLQPNRTRQR